MKISVILPVYNAAKYVVFAVESALQCKEVCEVLLIEDHSPDNALEVCGQLAKRYDKVRLLQHPDKENHGAGMSRNLGIENATGDFLAFLDADDFYLPNRFEAEKELFQNPAVDGVYGALGVHYYSKEAKEHYYKVFGERLTTVYQRHSPESVFPGQLGMKGSFGLFSIDTLTLRKEALLNKMDIFFKDLRIHEDSEFFFRLSFYLNLYPGILDSPIAMRGVHEHNRITEIETKKIKPCTTKILLWKEIRDWAEQEAQVSEDIKLHIRRMHQSFEIANAPLLKKARLIIKYLICDYPLIRNGLYNINFRKLSTQIFC
ncbi:glycosyltransferase family 2 protein [Chryseobacterium potabilaquae]|uniref:Putative glycosyltransferase EpsJ n=1 Tax=Chryseobacterium potabilaquae TaxID=2675057 RepID=A0A6N4XAS6_9FLAO|nr:glycosyltransferase family 2 protein [Chryseobacterium potabilaquae]CAA7197401.1 putative glycosyltransferase EpsJ [Chryseobacterium potabilaquae]